MREGDLAWESQGSLGLQRRFSLSAGLVDLERPSEPFWSLVSLPNQTKTKECFIVCWEKDKNKQFEKEREKGID